MLSRLLTPDMFITVVARIIVLMTALPVHEFAHAFVANKMGDPTAREKGRMTLNPLAHLDPAGSLMILLFGVGYARPVPVDPRNFKNRKAGEIATSLAGPFSNIIMAFVMLCIAKVGVYATGLYGSAAMVRALTGPLVVFQAMVFINCSLAVFNLLPLPPLDGFHVVVQFLPQRLYNWAIVNQGRLLVVVLAVIYFGFLDGPLGLMSSYLFIGLDYATSFIELAFGL